MRFTTHSLKTMSQTVATGLLATLALTACGGGETEKVQSSINAPGGVWYGAFLEQEQPADDSDIDIGGMYLDITKDMTGAVKGAMSYQVYDCQSKNDLKIAGTKTRERLQVTYAKGNIDPRASVNKTPLSSASKYITVEVKGSYFDNASKPRPWGGTYDVSVLSEDKKRISTDCNTTYTQADKGKWSVYPADAQFGITASYSQSNNTLSWTSLKDAKQTLIMQLDSSKTNSSDSAFVKQLVQSSNLNTYNPVAVASKKTTLVVQVFDANNTLIGFDALDISQ